MSTRTIASPSCTAKLPKWPRNATSVKISHVKLQIDQMGTKCARTATKCVAKLFQERDMKDDEISSDGYVFNRVLCYVKCKMSLLTIC